MGRIEFRRRVDILGWKDGGGVGKKWKGRVEKGFVVIELEVFMGIIF